MKIPKKAKRNLKKSIRKNQIEVHSKPQRKVVYSFNEGDLVTTNPKDHNFEDTDSICLVLHYSEGEYVTVWRPTGEFSARSATVRIIQRA
jgi:hypothetical protein